LKSFLSGFTLTLYDLFGYLTPGVIGLSGIGLFFWAVLDPGLKPDGDLKAVVWAALFLIAYLLGHALQAISSYIPGLNYSPEGSWGDDLTVKPFKPVIEAKLKAKGLLPTGADQRQTYRMCDVVVTQKAATSEHELFTYREGFYRGVSVGLILLAIGLFARLLKGPATITLDKDHTATRWMLFFYLAAAVIAACLYFVRFKRFSRLKAWTVLLGGPASLVGSGTGVDTGETSETGRARPKFEVYEVRGRKYRWRLRAANGQIIAMSDDSFASESNAREAVETVQRTVPLSETG
jgi:uncharacterized protein YegP (UPF0339 family)